MQPMINSPFTSLSDVFYDPTAMGTSANQAASDISARTNPYMLNKHQGLNRGLARGLGPSMQQQGTAYAMRQAAPIQSQLQDQIGNSQWQLQKANANEGFGAQSLSNLFRAQNLNNDPTPGFVQQQYARQMMPFAGSMIGQIGGVNPLSQLFSMFGG